MSRADSHRSVNLGAALTAWQELLGVAQVCVEPSALAAAERTTFVTTQRIPAILTPANRSEVQQCLRIANEYGVALYPTSTGKNWGYGSRVPASDGNVLLSLRRLDRIVHFDERLAYVTLEPGVTFQQLHAFLREQRSRRILWGTGSSPSTSIVGNTLERGLGRGPSADRWQQVCALEVILPSGECVHTGFARYAGASAGALHRAGVGPALDGLFSQSNLGVVTQLALWLDTAPAVCQRVAFLQNEPQRLAALVDVLRELMLPGTLRLSFSLLNRERARSVNPEGPSWRGEGVLASSCLASAVGERALLEEALRPYVDVLLFEPRSAHPELLGPEALEPAYAAKGANSATVDSDPDRDGCGLLFFAPVLPFDGAAVDGALVLVERIGSQFGFRPGVSLRCVTPRAIYLVGSIHYDRSRPGEDERAARCHRELLSQLAHAGLLPYRLGIQDMESLPPCQDDSGRLLQSLKRTLDPHDILAPGRYDFRHDWHQEG